MRIVSTIFLVLIILLGVTFATLNSQNVSINYYVGHSNMPLSLLLVLVFGAGCILGVLVVSWLLIKVKMKNHHLRRRLKLAEKEVENLRGIPLKNEH
jgi:putative membrane protein